MNKTYEITRQEAIASLAEYGIEDAQIYLIDLIPLIEMIWADGSAQDSEVAILNTYLKCHVSHINAIAGHEILTMEGARAFVTRFLKDRPDPELLKTLRSFVVPIRLADDTEAASRLRGSLLAACLDIAASSVSEYPFGLTERFTMAEKQCFFEILESL